MDGSRHLAIPAGRRRAGVGRAFRGDVLAACSHFAHLRASCVRVSSIERLVLRVPARPGPSLDVRDDEGEDGAYGASDISRARLFFFPRCATNPTTAPRLSRPSNAKGRGHPRPSETAVISRQSLRIRVRVSVAVVVSSSVFDVDCASTVDDEVIDWLVSTVSD